MRETWVRSLGWEDPLEEGKATHSNILTEEFPGLYSPWGRQVLDRTERLSQNLVTVTLTVDYNKKIRIITTKRYGL